MTSLRWLTVGVPGLAIAAALLLLGVRQVWPFLADDALISLRFAQRLADGAGLNWSDGERAEGYSNLLWVLACAAGCEFGLDPLTALRGLGAACSGITLLAVAMRFRGSPAAVAAASMLAVAVPTAAWTIGGLEMPLLLMLLVLALLSAERGFAQPTVRRWLLVGTWLAGVSLTRPDGPLFAVVLAGVAWFSVSSPMRRKTTFALLAPVVCAVVGQEGFRVLHHGDWLPNTARVKLGVDLASGVEYVGRALWSLRALVLVAAIGAWTSLRRASTRPFGLALLGIFIAWSTYLACVGGDFFPALRLFVPVLAPLSLLAGLGLSELVRRGRTRIALALAAGAVALGFHDASRPGVLARVAADAWVHRGLAIGAALREAFAVQRPLLAVDAAGAVPFASGFPAIDMFGLCDREIPRRREQAAATMVDRAHRRGDAAYLLARRPDVFLFGAYPGTPLPDEATTLQLLEDPRFIADYRCVWFAAGDVAKSEAPLWMALDGRIGCRRSEDRIELPAYFLGSWHMVRGMRLAPPGDAEAAARWAAVAMTLYPWGHAVVVDGDAWLEVNGPGGYRCRGLVVPTGDFDVHVDPPVPGVEARIVDESDAAFVGPLRPDQRRVSVVLDIASSTWPVRVRTVVLRRRVRLPAK